MWLLKFFKKSNSNKMKKFLIVGLGNIGEEYKETRHNIGFKILNELINKNLILKEKLLFVLNRQHI